MDVSKQLQQAVAAAITAFETNAPPGLLVRQFGAANARTLISESRGAVVKLYKAYRTVAIAIKHWDGSSRSAVRIARSTLLYQGRMRELESILGARTVKSPPVHWAAVKRRKERAAYHRDRRSDST